MTAVGLDAVGVAGAGRPVVLLDRLVQRRQAGAAPGHPERPAAGGWRQGAERIPAGDQAGGQPGQLVGGGQAPAPELDQIAYSGCDRKWMVVLVTPPAMYRRASV